MSSSFLGVGIVGFGLMGRTHWRAYTRAAQDGFPCHIVAVADRNIERIRHEVAATGNISGGSDDPVPDFSRFQTFTDAQDLFRSPEIQVVSICTHTSTHVDLARSALAAGKHVLIEKPVDLGPERIDDLAAFAREKRLVAMPAHCMRFWPGWDWLADHVRRGTFGRVLSATFQRLSAPPSWSREFYGDFERSGGALMDLHIHDADFIRFCFGEPTEVFSAGDLRHLTTAYRFSESGPHHVIAEGAWDLAPGTPFRMTYLVNFEDATADFNISRTPKLLLHRDGRSEEISLSPLAGYDFEVRHFLDLVQGRALSAVVHLSDAAATARLLLAEKEALGLAEPPTLPSR